MTTIGLRHWLVVLAIAVVAHAALLIRFQVQDNAAATTNSGASGVRIALAPTPGKPKPEQVAADATQDNDTPEPEPEPEPEPAPPPPAPEPQTEPDPVPQPQAKPEPTPTPTPVPAPEPEPKPKPKPKKQPKPEPRPAPEPEPKPKPRPEPRKKTRPAPSQPTRSAQRADNAKPAGGKDRASAPAQGAQAEKQTRDGATAQVSDTPANYQGQLGAWLQRYKQYPRRARRLRQEGTVVLYFVMDRDGHVLKWDIRQSSGHKLLDDAVRDMIRKADPLPALPSSMSEQRLEVTVPVRFQLR